MQEDNSNKKVLILFIIGLLILISLVVGATYAYFTFSSDNQFGTQTIEATTEAIGSGVTLTKTGEPLTLDVSAIDMLEDKIGSSYYASGSETPATIGSIKATGEGTFNCTYTMTISATSTSEDKNLYTKFQNMTNKSEGQIYLEVNEQRYDFNTANLFPITYNGTVDGISNASDQYITANLTIANTNIDQTELNDADISLTFEVTQFDCELDTSPISAGTIGNDIYALETAGLNTTMEGGLYRYQGIDDTSVTATNNTSEKYQITTLEDNTNSNLNQTSNTGVANYICFGTSDKSTCTGNTDAYMYRIIGIASDGRIKVLKNEALGSTMQWYSSYTSNIAWPSSTIYSNINGSSFLSNTTYVPSGWSDKIATTTWKYGDNTSVNYTASALYDIENAWTNTTSAKIGLIYLHDWYYAYQSGGLNCSSSGSYSTCKTAWMFLGICDSGAPSTAEWTMSRYGYDSTTGTYRAWDVVTNGSVYHPNLTGTFSVRPVFYLTSDVEFVGGTGTSSDPFIIK